MEMLVGFIKAFLVGGILCAAGQILIDRTMLTPARILTIYVVGGVVLGAVGIYEPFAEWAGAGATVPLLGFGNTLARGVRQAVYADGFMGALTGGLTSSAAGVTAAMFFSLVCALVFKPREKYK